MELNYIQLCFIQKKYSHLLIFPLVNGEIFQIRFICLCIIINHEAKVKKCKSYKHVKQDLVLSMHSHLPYIVKE